MPLCRASELDRLLNCPGSLFLPHDIKRTGESARWGTLVHEWMETGILPSGKDGAALKKRIQESGTQRDALWPSAGEFEVAFAFNITNLKVMRYIPTGSVEITAQRAAKDAWKQAFDSQWIVGTADYCGELLDSPWIDDLKTGRYAHWTDFAAQQTFYSMVYCLWKYKEFRDVRSTVTHWSRYPINKPPVRKGVVLEAEHLKKFATSLVNLGTNKTLWAGNHCLWCPAQNNCDEYKRVKL